MTAIIGTILLGAWFIWANVLAFLRGGDKE